MRVLSRTPPHPCVPSAISSVESGCTALRARPPPLRRPSDRCSEARRMDIACSDGGCRASFELVEEKARHSMKRPPEDAAVAKKRRKQLKPVRITTCPDLLPSDMVQVPKNDLVSCSEIVSTVPQAKPARCPLKNVPLQNDFLGDSAPVINVPNPDSGPSLSTLAFPFYQPHGLWPDRGLKIFNQEAYCELCKKEFCNKYFLKTHKANKHGIYNDFGCAQSNADSPDTTGVTVENGNGKAPSYEEDDKTKAFCDLCNKSFCNKYFVRRHKTKSHGIEDIDGDTYPVQNNSTNEARSTLNQAGVNDTEEEEPLNLIVTADSETSSEAKQDECTENLEKLQTMLLRLNPDGDVEIQTDDSSDLEPITSKTDQEGTNQCLRRRQSKPTSSYCEICNKELCNKYFMRTHMQRMHGIELEHGAQIGGVVCNICNKELCSKYFLRVHKQNTHGVPGPTGLPVMRPDVKTLPRPTNFSQMCLICSKRFRSSKWLQAHLQSDHREELQEGEDVNVTFPAEPPVNVISKLLWETNSMSNVYSCSQCAFTTPVLAFLFVHERSHFLALEDNGEAVKPSLALQDLIHNKTFWQHAITQHPPEGLDLTARSTHSTQS